MNWILCGFKGCGKTYFGKRLGLPFIDVDILIEEKEGSPIPDLVLQKGIEYFRKVEKEIIAGINVKESIIASGGGSVLDPENLMQFQNLGKLIYLNCPKAILKRRALTPPLPTFIDGEESFEEIYSTRIPVYEKITSHSINLEGKMDKEVLEELWQVINLDRSFA